VPPEAARRPPVYTFISVVSRRRWAFHLAASVAVAAIAALVLTIFAALSGRQELPATLRWPLALGITALGMVRSHRLRTRRASAAAIERAVPSCRNLIVTAEELERHPDRASAEMTGRVLVAAQDALSGTRPGHILPAYWTLSAVTAASVASLLTVPPGQRVIRESVAAVARTLPALGSRPRVRVRIEPPAYSGRPVVTLEGPDRIEALEGSRLTFALRGRGRVRFGATLVAETTVARESGYFAVEYDGNAGGGTVPTLLIPLSVTRDHAPTVRIDAPGKDLLLPGGERTIPVTIHASDDLALGSLELRYTKVSGSGEQFEFQEGTLPVRLQRTSPREWRASGELALAPLRLGPGDSLVYRAVARDQRPGTTGTAASDTYFIEIAGPGQVALEGVDMPPELERYAMSQQMIVMKIERLQKKASGLVRDALAEEAAVIAAEQRTVRANFVFLLGGHVEDEEEEAEQSHEIQEGRLENTARRDIDVAIGFMTRTAEGLTAVNPSAALPPARAAVEALQRAFGRSRYLLRALAVRSRLDPSRRLTGSLDDAGNWRRLLAEPDVREGDAARQLLERLLAAVASLEAGGKAHMPALEPLAESALAINSASPVWQQVARRLLDVRDAETLRDAIAMVAPEARRGGLPRTTLAEPLSPLSRAFRAERRP